MSTSAEAWRVRITDCDPIVVAHAVDWLLAREAEREATPPAPAVDDEPPGWQAAGLLTPPTAPEPREDAVEALAREVASAVIEDSCDTADRDPGQEAWDDALNVATIAVRHVRSLLVPLVLDEMGQVRGAVPGYGPTGDRAGEVRVRAEDLRIVLAGEWRDNGGAVGRLLRVLDEAGVVVDGTP